MQARKQKTQLLASPGYCTHKMRQQDTVKIDQEEEKELKFRAVQSELSNMQQLDHEYTKLAPILSGRNFLLDSNGSSTRSPSHLINGSCGAFTSVNKRIRNRATVQQSLDTDRKELVDCLEEDFSPAAKYETKVLTRLL